MKHRIAIPRNKAMEWFYKGYWSKVQERQLRAHLQTPEFQQSLRAFLDQLPDPPPYTPVGCPTQVFG